MIRRFLRISRSILEEWTAMFSGRFPPYHKMGIAVAVITTVAFSIILSHDVVFEAPVAVIDLDQSRWSAELIEKLNASSYLQVERVVHSPADPRRMTAHDRVQAVIFIPKDAQASLLRGAQTVRLGTYLDDSNTAQNGGLISQLNEITAELSAERAASRPGGVSALGQTTAGTEALLSPLRMGFRYLSNPTGQGATGTVINFLLFFSLMFHGLTSLMIIGRLRVTGLWNTSVLSGSLVSLLLRGVPYALIYTTVVTTAISVLTTFGQLRFAGSIWQFVPVLFLGAMANTWVAYLLSWNCKNPGEGAGRMIFLVPVGFILGGATMAVGFLHGWVKFASFGIPLVWIFNFWRDIGLRGIDWAGMADLWGCFFGYLTFIALLVGIRFWREEVKMMAYRKDAWETLRDVENASAELDQFPDPDGRRGEPIFPEVVRRNTSDLLQ